MTLSAMIVAAGRGTRAGGSIPKQYRHLNDKAVLHHTIMALLHAPEITKLFVIIHPDDLKYYDDCITNITDKRIQPPIMGGASRSETVAKGLAAINEDFVLIHDGARPLLSRQTLNNTIEALKTSDAVFCAVPVIDALWHVKDGKADAPQRREGLWRAQTPQAFKTSLLKAAYKNLDAPMDDDVGVVQKYGTNAIAILGDERNIKITHDEDFERAKQFMDSDMDVRTGIGYDVHALEDGDEIILNGIKIAHNQTLAGHSDADVAMHAITDALFGAVAQGDIGRWFPPSDPQWKGAASDIFLKKAVQVVKNAGFEISNIDCTIICENPKITPHAQAMCENLAQLLEINVTRISVKATTSERLGFTGRSEGIAAQAIATVIKT